MSDTPRMYSELSELWQFVSPPEEYIEEVATFRARLERHGLGDGASLLHLGSGGGSIDYHLKRTNAVTGVDVSPDMIRYAARINPEVEYVEGDIRTVRLGRTFDAVLVHDAISYMTSVEELEMVYRTAAAHLEIGGLMIALPEELTNRIIPDRAEVSTHTSGSRVITLIELDHDPDPSDHRFESVYIFLIREGEHLQVEVDRHVQGVFELAEFMEAMNKAGFDARAEPWELSEWKPGEEMPLVVAVRRH